LPIGSGPLQIGITAGTYVDHFSVDPGDFGLPVRAVVRVMHQIHGSPSPTITYPVTVQRTQLCP
jgi:hypothetical protein